MFIAIYGINNIGKSYHAKRLVRRFKKEGIRARYLKYPIYNLRPTGPLLNSLLRNGTRQKISEQELQLIFTLNRFHFEHKLKHLLQEGEVVIAEDYIGTGIAWGMAKGAQKKELENMNKFLVQPDVSVLLVGKRTISAQERGHLHEENELLIRKCERNLRALAQQDNWIVVEQHEKKNITAQRFWSVMQKHVLPFSIQR